MRTCLKLAPLCSTASVASLAVILLLSSPQAGAHPLDGKKLRAQANTVISAELHLLAERESRRRSIPLPTVTAPGELEHVHTLDQILMREGMVTVVVSSLTPSALVPELEAIGMTDIFVYDHLNHLRGSIALESLFEMESLRDKGLLRVQAEYKAQTNRGAVTSQADWLHEADRVRMSVDGYTGAGQRIGTLSDSYNRLGGAVLGEASGDLPLVDILAEGTEDGPIDEGRAMIELMYDLAPDASYAFATAFSGQGNFANNIRALAADTPLGNCNIIVDDVFYLAEPYFQDGIIAEAINEVVIERDVTYFSSAGNRANRSWEMVDPVFLSAAEATAAGADFSFLSAASLSATDYEWLDFDSSSGISPTQLITLAGFTTIFLGLQWDDPFFAPSSVENDLDIFFVFPPTGALITSATNTNLNTVEPLELIGATYNGAGTAQLEVYIGRWISQPGASTGTGPTHIKWVNFGSSLVGTQFNTASRTIVSHATAVNAMAVAAVDYFTQEGFAAITSEGPSTILFSPTGVRLAEAEVRDKPNFAAIHGTNTTFFGQDYEGDGFPNFFGTSAAAPHAAAIAALVRQRFPRENAWDIYERLKNSGERIGSPLPPVERVGSGLINAWRALYGDVEPVSPPYSTGFESGLGNEWRTRRTNAAWTQVTDQHGPAAGSQHLVLHSIFTGDNTNGRAMATLHLDLTGFENVELSFLHRRGPSEFANPLDAVAADLWAGDGVQYRVEGQTLWKRIVSLTGTNSTTTTQPFNFNLSEIATNNGDSLDGIVEIRFLRTGPGTVPNHGHFHDEVVVTGTPIGGGIPGDVNSDGVVNVADVTLLGLYLDGEIGSLPSLDNADFNGDAAVNMDDLMDLVDAIVND